MLYQLDLPFWDEGECECLNFGWKVSQLDLPFWDEGECECLNFGWKDCVCDLDLEALLEAWAALD